MPTMLSRVGKYPKLALNYFSETSREGTSLEKRKKS